MTRRDPRAISGRLGAGAGGRGGSGEFSAAIRQPVRGRRERRRIEPGGRPPHEARRRRWGGEEEKRKEREERQLRGRGAGRGWEGVGGLYQVDGAKVRLQQPCRAQSGRQARDVGPRRDMRMQA